MKENVLKSMPYTGECEVDINETIAQWDKYCSISQYREKYTLVSLSQDLQIKLIKCQISKIQAYELIGKLDLICQRSELFRNASTWRKAIDSLSV